MKIHSMKLYGLIECSYKKKKNESVRIKKNNPQKN